MFKTPINYGKKDDNLCKIGLYHQNDEIGSTEISKNVKVVVICSNEDNLFAKHGNFNIQKCDLAKGIFKVKYCSDYDDDGYACVRVFVKPKEMESNKILISSKQNSIQTHKQNLKNIKIKIQELEKEQENEQKFLEALQKGINTKEKADQVISILELLGYDKQKFIKDFFSDYPDISKLEDELYLKKIEYLLDLNDEDLANRYNQLSKKQLMIYFYGEEIQREKKTEKNFDLIDPGVLEKLIHAAHNSGVSFLLLNEIFFFLDKNDRKIKIDLKSNLKLLLEEQQNQLNLLNKSQKIFEEKQKKISLLDSIICLFHSQESSNYQIDRFNALKNSDPLNFVLEKNQFIEHDTCEIGDFNEFLPIKNRRSSSSSLTSISTLRPLHERVLYDSICDDFCFENISFEDSNSAYNAPICINRIKSSKVCEILNNLIYFFLNR